MKKRNVSTFEHYRFDFFFGKDWEKRKIQEEMNKNKEI